MTDPELWFPVDRVIAAVGNSPDLRKYPGLERRFRKIRSGDIAFVSLRVVDDLLSKLSLTHLLQIPREDGGLGDIYVDGKQYGSPDRSVKKPDALATTIRYTSEEARVEAKRRAWRESSQRARDRKREVA